MIKSSKPKIRRLLSNGCRASLTQDSPQTSVLTEQTEEINNPTSKPLTSTITLSDDNININDNHIVIIDNEKDNQQDSLIDLTKDYDSDIAVIHVKKNRNNKIPRSLNQNRHLNEPNSTIVIDDDNNDNEIITISSSSNHAQNNNNNTLRRVGNNIETNSSDRISSKNKSTPNKLHLNPFKRQKLIANDNSNTNNNATNINNNNSDGKKSELTCPICLETLEEIKSHNKTLMVTLCGHIMCNQCVDLHFKSNQINHNKNICCPTCRNKITRNKIHGLYI